MSLWAIASNIWPSLEIGIAQRIGCCLRVWRVSTIALASISSGHYVGCLLLHPIRSRRPWLLVNHRYRARLTEKQNSNICVHNEYTRVKYQVKRTCYAVCRDTRDFRNIVWDSYDHLIHHDVFMLWIWLVLHCEWYQSSMRVFVQFDLILITLRLKWVLNGSKASHLASFTSLKVFLRAWNIVWCGYRWDKWVISRWSMLSWNWSKSSPRRRRVDEDASFSPICSWVLNFRVLLGVC